MSLGYLSSGYEGGSLGILLNPPVISHSKHEIVDKYQLHWQRHFGCRENLIGSLRTGVV